MYGTAAAARGGLPQVVRGAAAVAAVPPSVAEIRAARFDLVGWSSYVKLSAASNPVRFYHTEEDFIANRNYVEILSGASDWFPFEYKTIWVRATGGAATFVVHAAIRKG